MNIDSLDLNLIRAFHALSSAGTVTQAAQKLGVSQPAMSHSLNRLRELLKDDVLVRTSKGMVLTPRAQTLAPQVQQALAILEQALTPQSVVPAQLQRTFTMGMADYTELIALPGLSKRIEKQAPLVELVCRQSAGDALAVLESADVDLWLGVSPPSMQSLYSQKLFSDDYLCAVRQGHPLAGKRLTPKQFAAMRHVQIAPGNTPGGPLDTVLASMKLSRQVAVRVPHFLVAPHLVVASDMVLTAPSRIMNIFAKSLKLHLFKCPVEVPGFTLLQVWHQRFHQDPIHRWFRELVFETLQKNATPRHTLSL